MHGSQCCSMTAMSISWKFTADFWLLAEKWREHVCGIEQTELDLLCIQRKHAYVKIVTST